MNNQRVTHLLTVLTLLLTLGFLAAPGLSNAAELKGFVDRNIVQMGQFIEFSVTLSGKSSSKEPDFSPLKNDFNILGNQSKSSQTRIINGNVSSSTVWSVTITPKQGGALVIPPIELDGMKTDPITIVVGEAPQKQHSDAWFETSVNKKQVYVQEQLRLDLKLYIRMADIYNSQLEELEIPGTKIIPVGKGSQDQIVKDGIRYYMVEKNYFIYPEQSGELTIPSISYNAIVNEGSRYSRFGNRRNITARSDKITIKVKGIPEAFPKDAVWLPAESILLAETFSPGDKAEAGEPITRNIITKATGLPASALPPIQMKEIEGLKIYPDQGTTHDNLNRNTIVGTRNDTFALISNQPATIELPTFQLPWWDTRQDKLRFATLDSKALSFSGNLDQAVGKNDTSTREQTALDNDKRIPGQERSGVDKQSILILGGIFLLLWIITVAGFLFYIRLLKQNGSTNIDVPVHLIQKHENSRKALKRVSEACKESDPKACRESLIKWGQIHFESQDIKGLEELADRVGDGVLKDQLVNLDASLYKDGAQESVDYGSIYKSLDDFSRKQKENAEKNLSGKKLADLYRN